MAKTCGEVKALSHPIGGGMIVTDTTYVYADGSQPSYTKQSWTKSRMVFPVVHVGDTHMEHVFVANDQMGHDIAAHVGQGDQVCLFTYGHLFRRKVIIGMTSQKGTFLLPARGLVSGLFWYAVFSPIVVAIPAVIIGMLVGSLGGRAGTARGLMFGFLYAVGISWYSGFRLYKAYQEMRASST
jgi:hypothetical protein